MLRGTGRRSTRLYVTNWRVACPRRADVELDDCLSCGHLGLLDGGQPPRFIECRWRAPSLDSTADRYGWFERRA